ncbi:GntR family transcriptional regulator [Acetobacteraceae bacterium H6797]|nr:GntR family transcriptional regulator [Acetobacteraceae bacterium H6797]
MAALPQPLPYHLLELIRQGIIDGRYPPGSALREQGLEAEYGCSRGPIREALRLLEQRGLATHEPRRGYRVRRLDLTTVRQLYALRALLERHAIEGVAGRVTPTLLEALRAENEKMRRHRAAHEVADYIAANVAFHEAILAAAPNEPLARALKVTQEVGEPLRHFMLRHTLAGSRALEEHEEMVEALESGRFQEAAEIMQRHVMAGLPGAEEAVARQAEEAR